MAGFFGLFDYTKPGKGVDPDAPQKHPFFLFWELYWRKFSKFILLNMVYFLILSPIILYLYTSFYSVVITSLKVDPSEVATILFQIMMSIAISIPEWLRYVLMAASVILYGPATAGLTYMLRNYAREEHAWFSDFFARAKANFKQSLFFGLLDALVFIIMSFNISYLASGQNTAGATGMSATMIQVSGYVSVLFMLIFTFMRFYTYTLLITFDLKIMQILKNSFIFAIVGLWKNVIALLCTIAFAAVVFLIHPVVELILLPLFALSFWGFIAVFTCYPVIKKYMIDSLNKEEAPEGEQTENLGESPEHAGSED
jgi:uncharacterized membrane protein YesL